MSISVTIRASYIASYSYRVTMHDIIVCYVITSIGKKSSYGFSMESKHFVVACLLKMFVNTTMIAGGRKESTTKDLKVL